MGFIDQLRSEGFAVESICRVLKEQGVKIAARTYRSWRQGRVATRTVSDALVMDAVREIAWKDRAFSDGTTRRVLTPEGLYGRKKMTAFVRRTTILDASRGAVDRAMHALELSGITRAKGIRTTVQSADGQRAADLLDRDFTATRPDQKWVMDFTYVRCWAGWVYVAFILDVYAQRSVAWHAHTTRTVDLVLRPLQIALWERDRTGHPIEAGQLIAHSDAGSQGGFNWLSQHPDPGGVQQWQLKTGSRKRAMCPRIHGVYKTECIRTTVFHDGPYKTIADVEFATAGWVDWYNHRRLHGSLGMIPPAEFEEIYYAAPARELSNT